LLTLYITPVIYLYMERLQGWFRRDRATLASGEEAVEKAL
jgi:hypothetical protein